MSSERVVVETVVEKDIAQVWDCWTNPEHIVNWTFASADWHCPAATNDLQVGGTFSSTMAAKDGSMQFDFSGTYSEVVPNEKIAYAMEDGRKVEVTFSIVENGVSVVESFDPEQTHPREMQQAGWQAILNNYKAYVESIA